MTRRNSAPLARDARGAAMVFGIFFATFLVACIWSMYGTFENIAFRERVQDAADAAAFSSAVVHAKGMNLIVLINVVMAMLLAVVVALRIVETLCIVAIGICVGLAVPTFGASLEFVPMLTRITKSVHTSAQNARKVVDKALPVLSAAEKGVAAVVPVGANLTVITGAASHYNAFAAAIPARITLPVEGSSFDILCHHAGSMAGSIAALPFELITPVKAGIEKAVTAIVDAGPEWFCGGKGKTPGVPQDEDARWVNLPHLPSEAACLAKSADATSNADPAAADPSAVQPEDAEHERACALATLDVLAAAPARDGTPRVGEPFCPTECQSTHHEKCPRPEVITSCAKSAEKLADDASRYLGSDRVPGGEGAPYAERAALARDSCAPTSAHARDLRAFSWVERLVTKTFVFDPIQKIWSEDETKRTVDSSTFIQHKRAEVAYPCGTNGVVGQGFESSPDKPVCASEARCVDYDGVAQAQNDPCHRGRPTTLRVVTLREQVTQVVELLGCSYRGPATDAKLPDIDLAKELGEGKANTPMALLSDAKLGGKDFQIRAIALAKDDPPSQGLRTVAAMTSEPEGQAKGAVQIPAALARMGVSQAEYYFDWDQLGAHSLSDQRNPSVMVEWMWNMGWTARLRPFRRPTTLSNAGEPEPNTSGGGPNQAGNGSMGLDCSSLSSDDCAGAGSALEGMLGGTP